MRGNLILICAAVLTLLGQSAAAQCVRMHVIDFPALQCADTVLVFSPSSMCEEKDLPTLFLLQVIAALIKIGLSILICNLFVTNLALESSVLMDFTIVGI